MPHLSGDKEAAWKRSCQVLSFQAAITHPPFTALAKLNEVIAYDEILVFLQQGDNSLDLGSPTRQCQQLLPSLAAVLLSTAVAIAPRLCGDRLHSLLFPLEPAYCCTRAEGWL